MSEVVKTAEEMAKEINESLSAIKSQIENAVNKEDYRKEIKQIEDNLNAMKAEIKEENKKDFDALKETINLLKESLQGHDDFAKGMRDGLRGFFKKNHQNLVKAVKEGKPLDEYLEKQDPHMTNNGTVSIPEETTVPMSATEAEDFFELPRPELFVMGIIPNRTVSELKATKTVMDEAPQDGAAAITAEGDIKPLIQYKAVQVFYQRVKYAGRIEWSEEFEMDYEALLNAFIDNLRYDVVKAWQDDILDKIIADASPYVSSSLDGTLVRPDNGLAVVAIQAQIESADRKPNVVIMNPADFTALAFQQDADGKFILSPYIDYQAKTINGLRVFLTTSIDAGNVLVMDSTIFREEHTNVIIRKGQYDDQLIRNMYTLINEVFSILYYSQANLLGVVYADLEVVKTALEIEEVTP